MADASRIVKRSDCNVAIWKGTGTTYDPGRHRRITLQSLTLLAMALAVSARLRVKSNIGPDLGNGEEQTMDCLPSEKVSRR